MGEKLQVIICPYFKFSYTDHALIWFTNFILLNFSKLVINLEKWNTAFLEASTKTDQNVSQIFVELVKLIDKWREAQGKQDDKKVKTKRRAWTLL